MNCPNCGAGMDLVRDYFTCRYCATVHFPQATADGTDERVRLLGSDDARACPVCDQTLRAAAIERLPVAYCQTCRGVLTTNDTFRQLVSKLRAKAGGTQTPRQPINPEELARQVRCPQCRHGMDTHPYYGPGNVVVDTCARCFLIWLDHGELEVIEHA